MISASIAAAIARNSINSGMIQRFLSRFATEFPAPRHSFNEYRPRRHCQTNLNGPSKGAGLRRSGRQLTPFSERGSAVLFEDIAAVEVAVLVEVVVD